MLRFLLVTTAFFLSFTLIGQDKAHPVFVSTANLELIEKESAEYSQYTKDLKQAQANEDRQAISEAQGNMDRLLEKIIFRSQFIDPQLANHMDLDQIRKLKQEWVDGIGFRYYINLERFRGTPGLTEIQMTPAQYKDYVDSTNELKALKEVFNSTQKRTSEQLTAYSDNLIKANELVSSRRSLLLR